MSSGGYTKEPPYERIYIEAYNEQEAMIIFYNRFGHSPNSVACDCCGSNYTIDTAETLAEISALDRGCRTLT